MNTAFSAWGWKAVLLLFLTSGAYAQQSNVIDSLHAALKTVSGSDRVKVLTELSWEYRFSNADTARYYGLQGLEMAREQNTRDLIADALHTIGITYEAQGNYPEALTYALEALDIREQLGDSAKVASSLNNLGIIHDEMGDQKKALAYYYRALKIFEEHGLTAKAAGTIMNIGIVMKAQKDYAKAIEYYRRSGALYKQLKNGLGEGACYANLGSCYLHLPNYDSALYYSLKGSEFFERLNIRQSLPTTWTNAAIALDTLGRYAEARNYLVKARKAQESFGAQKELSYNLIQLSSLYVKTKQYDSALFSAERAIRIASEIQAPEQSMQGYAALASIKSKLNDFKGAYQAQLRYNEVKDSLFQSEKNKQILELETKYETEKKELQLAEQQLKLQQNQWLILFLSVSLLLIVALVLIWRRHSVVQQQKQLAEKQREFQSSLTEAVIRLQEKERARVAKDLHDGFGQYISTVQLYVSQTNEGWKQNATDLLNQMHREVRNIAFDLLPHTLVSSGLPAALKELAVRINLSNKVTLQLHATEAGERLDATLEVSLYRVCQEWINNILKYGTASLINVNLVQHDDELSLIIEDDGDGFDTGLLETSSGNGWRNIQSRVQLYKGTAFAESSPERKGTSLLIEIPLKTAVLNVA